MDLVTINGDVSLNNSLEIYISKIEHLNLLFSFNSLQDAESLLSYEGKIDLIFINLQRFTPDELQSISKLLLVAKVIFVGNETAIIESDGLLFCKNNIIIQPFSFQIFLDFMHAFKERLHNSDRILRNQSFKYFYLKMGQKNSYALVMYDKVISVESMNNYVLFKYENGDTREEEFLMAYASLTEVEKALNSSLFLRISRSQIIGIKFILKINGNVVTLKNGKEVIIGPKYRSLFFHHVNENLLVGRNK